MYDPTLPLCYFSTFLICASAVCMCERRAIITEHIGWLKLWPTTYLCCRKNHVSNVLFQLFPFCENLSLLFQKKCGSVIKGVKRSFIFSNLLFIIHLSLLSLLLCYLFSITEGKDGKRFCVVFVVVST